MAPLRTGTHPYAPYFDGRLRRQETVLNDTTLTRAGAVFLTGAIVTNLAAFAIGIARGLLPPPGFDFGDSQHLQRLAAEYDRHLLPLALSLLSPILAMPAGVAIAHVLRPAGWVALFGAAMFFIGMIFVVLLDVLELVTIARLAPAYGAAADFARPSILALGATIDTAIDVLGYIGHFFSFGLAQLAFAFAIVATPGVPNWLGWMSLVPALVIGWLMPLIVLFGAPAGAVTAMAMLLFLVWLTGMAVVLWRWQPREVAVQVEE